MSVKDVMNKWGRAYILKRYPEVDIPVGAEIRFDEEAPSPYYCETCGPDPYTTRLTYYPDNGDNKIVVSYYGTLGEIILDILAEEGGA